jgi:hypothetical protein
MFQVGIEFATKSDNRLGWNPNGLEIIEKLVEGVVTECLNKNSFRRVVV